MTDFLALALTMATLGIFAWVIRGLHKMEKETMALVRDLDRAWGIDNGEECK